MIPHAGLGQLSLGLCARPDVVFTDVDCAMHMLQPMGRCLGAVFCNRVSPKHDAIAQGH